MTLDTLQPLNYPVAQDPFHEREKAKYEHPSPSREYILQLIDEIGAPASFAYIADCFALTSDSELDGLSFRLKAMCRDGQLMQDRKQQYLLMAKADLVVGRVQGNKGGFGYLIPEDGTGFDIFLSPYQMQRVMHGDKAVVLPKIAKDRSEKRIEGKVIEVLEHGTKTLVGHLHYEDDLHWLVPDNGRFTQDVFIPDEQLHGATVGQVVECEILHYPSKRSGPIGKVVHIVGDYLGAGTELASAIKAYDLPEKWPQACIDELADIADEVQPQDRKNRTDLTKLPLITIDGETAKDFDDAVYAAKEADHWRLVVAIADVSHYVRPGTALDKEAINRGNSVYFPQQVLPMLPEKLSNGLCSLNPHVDRLCMVADMTLDLDTAALTSSRFYPAVMHSHARLTYNQVNELLMGDVEPMALSDDSGVIDNVWALFELYQQLFKQRQQRGALEFDSVEAEYYFNDQGKIDRIEPRHRNDAHRLIEEMMLMANYATAHYLQESQTPVLYRNHAQPDASKLEDLKTFLRDFNLTLNVSDDVAVKQLYDIQQRVADHPQRHRIEVALLRSMMQANYETDNIGHFGLGYDAYLHFTSPIRRYPDLIVHRALKAQTKAKVQGGQLLPVEALSDLGDHFSITERRADEATRDVSNFLKCEFLSHRLGEVYWGQINGVTNFGLFVELEDFYIEGLVHVTELGSDFFHYDSVRAQLVGERSGHIYQVGARVKVQVAQVVLEDKKIDFKLVELPQAVRELKPKPSKGNRKKGGKSRKKR